MPTGSQVWGWASSRLWPIKPKSITTTISEWFSFFFFFSVGQAFFNFSFPQTLSCSSNEAGKEKKNTHTHITKLSNQSLMAFLVILHSLARTQPQFQVTRIPLLQDQQECFYIVRPLLTTHPSFPDENEENETSLKVRIFFFISLVLVSLLVTGAGMGEQPSGTLTGGHPYAAVMFPAN